MTTRENSNLDRHCLELKLRSVGIHNEDWPEWILKITRDVKWNLLNNVTWGVNVKNVENITFSRVCLFRGKNCTSCQYQKSAEWPPKMCQTSPQLKSRKAAERQKTPNNYWACFFRLIRVFTINNKKLSPVPIRVLLVFPLKGNIVFIILYETIIF